MNKTRDPFKEDSFIMGRDKAERYEQSLKSNLKSIKTEEDVRAATYHFLKELSKEVGVNINILNEKVVISGGRIDSLFDNIIIEFKKPKYFKNKSGINEAVNGRKSKGGLIEYILSTALKESNNLDGFKKNISTKIGIGFDGDSFIFVRYVLNVNNEINIKSLKKRIGKKAPEWLPDLLDGYFEITSPRIIKSGLRFLFLYLRSISPRAPLTPDNVSKRFGEDSIHFRKHLKVLYPILLKNIKKEPHVNTLYNEWNRVFGKVYGDLDSATSKIKNELTEKYKEQIDFQEFGGLNLKLLIFSIHTYYNIILKLLISELFSSILNPFSSQKTVLALNDDDFKERVKDIMSGRNFRILGVENFFEISFFEWWLYIIDNKLSGMLREVIALIQELEVTTSITKPELIGDMVKQTYHDLMPQGLRHLLGEYFTPDWLAEKTINLTGYSGKLNETFLDPSCGSGTFLAIAIKKKLMKNNETKTNEEVIKDILSTIVGFDLNPISVIASKTNYLLSLGDLSGFGSSIKIPVYQCDSILTPSVHAQQKKNTNTFEIGTHCGKFRVPALNSREDVENLLDIIKEAIINDFSDEEFLTKTRKSFEKINEKTALNLFKKIRKLSNLNRNGLWIPILKNSFAPVYSRHQFDYVVGNPPWVSWRHMSKSYRDLTLPIWLSYDIFHKSAYDKMTTHDDFAMAFTYVSADHYLKKDGKLCFVISQTFFKSKKGGEGFRKFRITRGDINIPLKIHKVIDMVSIRPFKEAMNRTSVMLLEKGKETAYPVDYIVWDSNKKIEEDESLNEVERKINKTNLKAIPIGGIDEKGIRSPWLTLPQGRFSKLKNIIGESAYRGRKGVEPLGAKGMYVLEEPQEIKGRRLRIKNDLSRGRLIEIEKLGERVGLIESEFVYPLISGRNIDRYGLNSCSYILLPHENKKGPHNAVPESVLKVDYTATYEWLSYFKDILLITRKRNGKFFDEKKDPFYLLDNVGTYTFSPYKVVWREQHKKMISCVVSTKKEGVLKGRLIIPDSKVLFCPLEDKEEAHYLCAVLNSKHVREVIEGYTIELQRGIDVLSNVKIPKYNSKNKYHKMLSKLSEKAHQCYAKKEELSGLQKKIDEIVLNIFSI